MAFTTQPEPPVPSRIPEDNLPGHHPEHEQDKPAAADFVAKMHALAQDEDATQPPREDEVLDLTQVTEDHVHTGHVETTTSVTGERLAHLAGKPFGVVGAVLGAVRDRLPD
jgi:hypothetical protein